MTYRVPRSRATETHRTLREEILKAFDPILFGDFRATYSIRAEFERAFANEMEQAFGVGVHSGTMGLFVALLACGIGVGDEVITVANSDISTTGVIRRCGAVPVLCDVLESDYTIDTSLVEGLITTKTRAILPVDLHGHPANVKALRSLAEKYELKIIEDAALAAGARDYGEPVGKFADVAIFSFAPIKPFGSAANGAMIVTSDEEIYRQLRLLVGYGHDPDFPDRRLGHQNYIAEGFNVPLDGLESALLLVKLPFLKKWTAHRRSIAEAFQAGLRETSAQTPSFRPESEPTFRSYVICVDDQQKVYQSLLDSSIEAVLHYTPPIYQYTVYQYGLRNAENLPVTSRLANVLVNLPVTPELTQDDTSYVVNKLRKLLAS